MSKRDRWSIHSAEFWLKNGFISCIYIYIHVYILINEFERGNVFNVVAVTLLSRKSPMSRLINHGYICMSFACQSLVRIFYFMEVWSLTFLFQLREWFENMMSFMCHGWVSDTSFCCVAQRLVSFTGIPCSTNTYHLSRSARRKLPLLKSSETCVQQLPTQKGVARLTLIHLESGVNCSVSLPLRQL